MTYRERILNKINAAFAPLEIHLEDESAKHAGHAGAHPSGETHFKLLVVSSAFTGKNRVERQRMVYEILKNEMAERVHALSLSLRSPDD